MENRNNYNNKYIGVFDSGVGGLTVLQDLQEYFPNENFLYLGDTARCPYGTKKDCELKRIVESDIRYFETKNVKMLVIACNTATAASYDIKSTLPIVRIIEPTCNIVKEVAKSKGVSLDRVAILSTNYTAQTHAYNKFLDGKAIEVKCSPWVDIIEQSKTNTKESKDAVEAALKDVKGKADIYVLACTHFGLLEEEIKEYLGDVTIINSSKCLKGKVKEILDEVGASKKREDVSILISGDIESVNCSWFRFSDGTSLDKKTFKHVTL